jgi:hypothetical protein
MTKYSTEMGNALRRFLFVRNDELYLKEGSPVTYDLKPGFEDLATKTWAAHGVCLNCKRWSLTCGRCPECSIKYHDPTLKGYNAEKAIQAQLELAAQALRRSA